MLKIRLIPSILKRGPTAVKGENFSKSRIVGPILPMIRVFQTRDVDELIIIDVNNIDSVNQKQRFNWFKQVSSFSTMPLSIGGGIRTFDQATNLIKDGADKVILNTAIRNNIVLAKEIIDNHGSQSLIASIDVKNVDNNYFVFDSINNKLTNITLERILEDIQNIGFGEIYLTSVDKEGSRSGYDLNLYKYARKYISIPLIANGGAGKLNHFTELANENIVEAFAAGACFHFSSITPREITENLRQNNFNVRKFFDSNLN